MSQEFVQNYQLYTVKKDRHGHVSMVSYNTSYSSVSRLTEAANALRGEEGIMQILVLVPHKVKLVPLNLSGTTAMFFKSIREAL